jgi:hypothetical protein
MAVVHRFDCIAIPNTFFYQVTQITCQSSFLAPPGCTQYYYGATTGKINTYNWLGGTQLANQQQNICFRFKDIKNKTVLHSDLFRLKK